jgi:N-acetylmuramoyl-L-alanine amidase
MNYKRTFAYTAIVIIMLLTISSVAKAEILTVLYGRDLALGSTGQDVVQLQGILAEQGYLNWPAGVPFGYFGQLTKSTLTNFQSANGLPATGYFGPMTRAKILEVFGVRGWLTLVSR